MRVVTLTGMPHSSYYWDRHEEVLTRLETMTDNWARSVMVRVALDYERLAKRAESLEKKIG